MHRLTGIVAARALRSLGQVSVVQAGRDCEAHWLVGRSGAPVSVAHLLIGCAGSVNPTFAGKFRIQAVRTYRFDTNLTPTHSLSIGLPIGWILGSSAAMPS